MKRAALARRGWRFAAGGARYARLLAHGWQPAAGARVEFDLLEEQPQTANGQPRAASCGRSF